MSMILDSSKVFELTRMSAFMPVSYLSLPAGQAIVQELSYWPLELSGSRSWALLLALCPLYSPIAEFRMGEEANSV